MATYTASLDTAKVLDSADVHIGEKHIYGSSRLGIITANYSTDANTDGLNAYTSPWTGAHLPYFTGKKQYELTNHLGNVLATITDKKIGISLTTDSSLIDHYEADVMTAQDYYPFGMIMPGRMYISLRVPGGSVAGTTQVNGFTVPVDLTVNNRTGDKPSEYVATQFIDLVEGFESGDSTDVVTAYLADTSYAGTGNGGSAADGVAGQGKYRYGFNGKEKDDEVKGVGDQIDYGMRVYDPRAGRFLSVDPLVKKYPELTPFQFASNRPIEAIDVDGLEGQSTTTQDDKKASEVPKDKSMVEKLDEAVQGGSMKHEKLVNMLKVAVQQQTEAVQRDKELKEQATNVWLNSKMGSFESKANLKLIGNYEAAEESDIKALTWSIGALYKAQRGDGDIKKYNEFVNSQLNLALYGLNAMATAVTFMPSGGASSLFITGAEMRASLFSLRGGYGIFGENGLRIGGYKIEAMYTTSNFGTGTIFSIKQMGKVGGNLLRWDYGLLHGAEEMGLHSTFRLNLLGKTFGSTKQLPWHAPFRFWTYPK